MPELDIAPKDYNPDIDKPYGVKSEHIGIRWKERFDNTIKSEEEAADVAWQHFLTSTYMLTAYDNEGKSMYYYYCKVYSENDKEDSIAVFVQSPINLKVVTVYEIKYGYGKIPDTKLFEALLEEYNSCKEKYDLELRSIECKKQQLDVERKQTLEQIELLTSRLNRIDSESSSMELKEKEMRDELQLRAHKLTYTIDYRIDALTKKTNSKRL